MTLETGIIIYTAITITTLFLLALSWQKGDVTNFSIKVLLMIVTLFGLRIGVQYFILNHLSYQVQMVAFIILTTIVFATLASIWKTNNYINSFVKTFFVMLTIWGAYLSVMLN